MSRIDFDQFAWIDLSQPTRNDLDELTLKYPFHQLNIEDCLSDIQVSKIDVYDDHSFIILRFPVVTHSLIDDKANPVAVNQLAVFIGPNYLVTVHKSPFKQLLQLFQSFQLSGKSVGASTKSPGHMLHTIIDALVDDVLACLLHIEHDVDIIERQVVEQNVLARNSIADLRIELATVNRLIVPVRRVIVEIAGDVKRYARGANLVPYYSDIRDHVDRIVEELQAAREAIDIYNDTVFMAGTEKSNRILGILTILFTLTIPVTVLSSFYGMNIEIPGTVQSGPWTFWGPYTTLIIVTIESIIPAVVMLGYFYRKKWTKV